MSSKPRALAAVKVAGGELTYRYNVNDLPRYEGFIDAPPGFTFGGDLHAYAVSGSHASDFWRNVISQAQGADELTVCTGNGVCDCGDIEQ